MGLKLKLEKKLPSERESTECCFDSLLNTPQWHRTVSEVSLAAKGTRSSTVGSMSLENLLRRISYLYLTNQPITKLFLFFLLIFNIIFGMQFAKLNAKID